MVKFIVAAVVATLLAASANADSLTWRIVGNGSGTLDGQAFDGRFAFVLKGDTTNHVDEFGVAVVDPLDQAAVRIAGLGTALIGITTRLGYNYKEGGVFFSRWSSQDLFDFDVDAPVDLTRSFAAVLGRNVNALNQFFDVPTSLGALTFATSSDVAFSAVPLPAAAPLLVVALAGAGCLMRIRRKTA